MTLPDVNVLVYAFREDASLHRLSRSWLHGTIAGDSRFALSRLTLAAFVRVVTNPRAYPRASSLSEAFAFCEDLLSQPHREVVEPAERHWDIFRRLCLETPVRGPDTTDAWYAALAIESGCEWVTFDRDFLRFPGLKCTILSASNN